ncbi:hypothetical protein [Thalassomonas actiniarum]|uniref:Uncharacterized protein n=1 Tax=Thalassomonas actiniarum TaxID=485447 RepID=A0AAE9YT46_9GAMM|nr:hypothetical protein [Thalassomonas actiniarum]WDD99828.1 hypothetical protein SG35_003915 [Thalassomonas actiniarum]
MAKHNDMPELNPTKVFSTNLFIKEHLKPHGQQPSTTGNAVHPRRHACSSSRQGYLGAAAVFLRNGDMNGITVYGFNRSSLWLKEELAAFAKNVHKLPA